jgi:hypothetical protein
MSLVNDSTGRPRQIVLDAVFPYANHEKKHCVGPGVSEAFAVCDGELGNYRTNVIIIC